MNESELDALMAESTKQFNELKVREGQLQAQLQQTDTGLKQLQGEYSAYETLKKALVEREGAAFEKANKDADATEAADAASLLPDPFRSKDEGKKDHANAAK